MYKNGEGILQDYKTAVKWYTLAAEQGNFFGQFNLGWMYYDGKGVLQDDIYAHMWWNIAALSWEGLLSFSGLSWDETADKNRGLVR